MTVRRWQFYDPATVATYVHQISPNTMTSPFRTHSSEVLINNLAYRRRSQMKDWSFGGVVRSEQQYNDLLAWSQKRGRIEVTDHLGRQFDTYLLEFAPDEQRPSANNAWRFNYTMTALVIAYLGVTA